MKELSLYETRVIGSLIEKSLTTPEQVADRMVEERLSA